MNQDSFEQTRKASWDSFAQVLEGFRGFVWRKKKDLDVDDFLKQYKAINRDLSLAQSRGYSQELIDRLNELVVEGHRVIHIEPTNWWESIWNYLSSGFPQEIRDARNYVWCALTAFIGPALFVSFLIGMVDSTYLYSVIPSANLETFENMYDPGNEKLGRTRGSSSDFSMFGVYIYNNISIALRQFAWGLAFGVGALVILAFNGIYLGAITYHLTAIGYSTPFYTFVIAHGALELTALVFAGAAGLILGYALLVPGRRTRVEALSLAAQRAIKIMAGVIIMLVVAAFIEAFWSSTRVFPPAIKYGVGVVLWLFVIYYFVFVGRRAA